MYSTFPGLLLTTFACLYYRFHRVHLLFFNAASLSTFGINWSDILWLSIKDPVGLMERSDATIQVRGEINQDGMGSMFAANVFGQYIIVSVYSRGQ